MKYQARSGIGQIWHGPEISPFVERVNEACTDYAKALVSGGVGISEGDNLFKTMEDLVTAIRPKNEKLADIIIWAAFMGASIRLTRTYVPNRFADWIPKETKEATDKKEVWE